jgi:hypothetical protein
MTRTVNRKTVGGISLRKIIGRNHHGWACSVAGYLVTFTPYLGRYNNKVNGWSFKVSELGTGNTGGVVNRYDEYNRPLYAAGNAPTLKAAVIEAQHHAVEARRLNKGLDPIAHLLGSAS